MKIINTSSVVGIIVGLIIAGSIGASVFAEKTLPGDFLYRMKTEVNENVRGSMIFSAAGEAHWESILALRRLEEIEMLVASSRLSPDIQRKLQREFDEHSIETLSLSEQAALSGDAKVASSVLQSFRAELDVRENALTSLSQEHPQMQEQIDRVVSAVRATKSQAQDSADIILARLSGDTSAEASVEIEAQETLDAAAKNIDEVNAALLDAKDVSESIRITAEASIQDATASLVRAREEMERRSYASAMAFAEQATTFAMEAAIILNISIDQWQAIYVPSSSRLMVFQ